VTSEIDRRSKRPRSGQRVGQQGKGQQRDSEFVNRELSPDETMALREWRTDLAAVDLTWREMLEDGYKFTIKFDDYSSSFVCFVFPSEGSDNSGFILAGRGGTGYRALSEAIYKHTELLGGEWGRGVSSVDGPNDPDW